MKRILCIFALVLSFLGILRAEEQISPHNLNPYFSYKKIKDSDYKTEIFSFGVGYRYIQNEGYNAKFNISLISAGSYDYNGEVEFQNGYRIKTNYDFDIMPFIAIKSEMYGVSDSHILVHGVSYNSNLEKKKSSQAVSIHGGFGILKKINDRFNSSIHIAFTRNLSRDMVIKYLGNIYKHEKREKLNGLIAHLLVNYQLNPNNFLEIEPYWGASFKDSVTQIGSKFSYRWNY